MKAIITGLNGTLAPVLATTLKQHDFEVVAWNREDVPTDNEAAMVEFLEQVTPDWICHLGMGDPNWAQFLGSYCQEQQIGFLFTSTAMVFHHEPDGPHYATDKMTAQDDYGRYKIHCENAINAVCPHAIIARIGWQIGSGRGGNNMIETLYRMVEKDGKIGASTRWIPATSYMTDTCEVLWQLMKYQQYGTYHIDSNTQEALTFFEIVTRLKARLGTDWVVEPNENYIHDQRLLDDRISVPSLSERL